MFTNMKMGTKILAAFALALTLMLVVGGVAYRGTEALRTSLEDVARAKMPSNNAIDQVNEAQTAVARGVATLLLRRAERLEPAVGLPGPELAEAGMGAVGRAEAGRFPLVSRGCERCPLGAVCRAQGVADLAAEEEAG